MNAIASRSAFKSLISKHERLFDLLTPVSSIYDRSIKYMKIGTYNFDTEHDCSIMGILNVTPDSFSDGGKWN